MAEFLYKAQNSQGNNFEGTLEAKDKAEAEALLLRRRLIITSLKKKPTEIKIKIGSGIKTEDITRFTRMFSSMCSFYAYVLVYVLGRSSDASVLEHSRSAVRKPGTQERCA